MTSRPENNRSADNQPVEDQPPQGQPAPADGSEAAPDGIASPPEVTPETTIPGMMPIIDVRATSVEGDSAAKNGSTGSRPKTDRGQDMFPDVAEVPPEYSGLFQDYDNASALGAPPLWLDGTETEANSRFKMPTLMLGGVVLTALASGMGLAHLHNMRQSSAKADPKSPKSTATQTQPADRTQPIAKASAQPAAKAASLASPERLRPNWLTPGSRAVKTASTGTLTNSPIAQGNAPIAPDPSIANPTRNSPINTGSAIPPLVLPRPKASRPISTPSLTPSLTSSLSSRPMLSAAALSSPRIFPARLKSPVVRPAIVAAATRSITTSAVSTAKAAPRPARLAAPDRFSSITYDTPSSSNLRRIDEVMADRLSPTANRPNSGKSQQARAIDNQGNEFGYEALRALRPAQSATVPTPGTPGTETAQWEATNRVITTTAATTSIVATPGLTAISMPALSISVQESLLSDPSIQGSSTEVIPTAANVWSPSDSQPLAKPLEPRVAPKASNPEADAPQAMAPIGLELAAIPSSSLDRTISSPEYSGTEYSGLE